MREKKIATIVLSVACGVTVLCMVLGIGLRIAPVRRRVRQNNSGTKNGWEKAADGETVYDSVKTLDLDIDMADVKIVKGKENKVKVDADDKGLLPEISYDGAALVIEQRVDGMEDSFSFSDLASLGNKLHTSIEITIKDELEALNADVSLGDIDISGVRARSFDFDAECGDVDITDCVFGGEAVVDIQLGDIDIQGVQADKLFVDSSMGDVDVEGLVCNECNLDINTGDLDITDTTFENLTVSINLGEVTVDTSGAYKDYAISAETSLGEVNVGGRSFGTEYDSGSGKNKIMIHNDMGAIRIK